MYDILELLVNETFASKRRGSTTRRLKRLDYSSSTIAKCSPRTKINDEYGKPGCGPSKKEKSWQHEQLLLCLS